MFLMETKKVFKTNKNIMLLILVTDSFCVEYGNIHWGKILCILGKTNKSGIRSEIELIKLIATI